MLRLLMKTSDGLFGDVDTNAGGGEGVIQEGWE